MTRQEKEVFLRLKGWLPINTITKDNVPLSDVYGMDKWYKPESYVIGSIHEIHLKFPNLTENFSTLYIYGFDDAYESELNLQ
jgi:hypothetical protein